MAMRVTPHEGGGIPAAGAACLREPHEVADLKTLKTRPSDCLLARNALINQYFVLKTL